MNEEQQDENIEVNEINIFKKEGRKYFKEEVSLYKYIDLGILDSYNEMSDDFKSKLNFDEYFRFYRTKIQDDLNRADSEDFVKELLPNTEEVPKEDIPEKELCNKCKKERKAHDDPEFCHKCINLLKVEADNRMEELKEELRLDTFFKNLSNETKRKVYVVDKYKEEKKKNKFIFLPKLAKEAYALISMDKS